MTHPGPSIVDVPVDYANAKLTAGLGQLICPICARRDEDGIPMEESVKGEETLERVVDELEESVKGEETLERVVDELSRRGYTEHFKAVEGGLQALGTGQRFEPKDLVIRGYYRFEGVSDPDDMAIAYAIESRSGVRGILIDAFGVYSDPTTSEVLKRIPMLGKSAA